VLNAVSTSLRQNGTTTRVISSKKEKNVGGGRYKNVHAFTKGQTGKSRTEVYQVVSFPNGDGGGRFLARLFMVFEREGSLSSLFKKACSDAARE